jgi:hypothetical protein
MSHNSNTVSESLHLNIEQSYDLFLEQTTAKGNVNRIQVSTRKQITVSVCRAYSNEESFTLPLLYES